MFSWMVAGTTVTLPCITVLFLVYYVTFFVVLCPQVNGPIQWAARRRAPLIANLRSRLLILGSPIVNSITSTHPTTRLPRAAHTTAIRKHKHHHNHRRRRQHPRARHHGHDSTLLPFFEAPSQVLFRLYLAAPPCMHPTPLATTPTRTATGIPHVRALRDAHDGICHLAEFCLVDATARIFVVALWGRSRRDSCVKDVTHMLRT